MDFISKHVNALVSKIFTRYVQAVAKKYNLSEDDLDAVFKEVSSDMKFYICVKQTKKSCKHDGCDEPKAKNSVYCEAHKKPKSKKEAPAEVEASTEQEAEVEATEQEAEVEQPSKAPAKPKKKANLIKTMRLPKTAMADESDIEME